MGHIYVLYTTNFLVEPKNSKQSFINRNKRQFDANKYCLDLSKQDWSKLYQCDNGNSMYNVLMYVFSITLQFRAPLIENFQPEKELLKNLG